MSSRRKARPSMRLILLTGIKPPLRPPLLSLSCPHTLLHASLTCPPLPYTGRVSFHFFRDVCEGLPCVWHSASQDWDPEGQRRQEHGSRGGGGGGTGSGRCEEVRGSQYDARQRATATSGDEKSQRNGAGGVVTSLYHRPPRRQNFSLMCRMKDARPVN